MGTVLRKSAALSCIGGLVVARGLVATVFCGAGGGDFVADPTGELLDAGRWSGARSADGDGDDVADGGANGGGITAPVGLLGVALGGVGIGRESPVSGVGVADRGRSDGWTGGGGNGNSSSRSGGATTIASARLDVKRT